MYDVLIIGGGAAGFFTAINIAEKNPAAKILILEASSKLLAKVKVSGGGRCNVTHACFDAQELIEYYPRGGKSLLGAFYHFGCADTMAWFAQRGVPIVAEKDGRCFPASNTSQSIVDCFLQQAEKCGVAIQLQQKVTDIRLEETSKESFWEISTTSRVFHSKNVVVCCGSSAAMWQILEKLGHRIIAPVPSLFAFNTADKNLHALSGVSVAAVEISVENMKNLQTEGAILLTHKGLSGPAVLKLSAWGTRFFAEKNYHFFIKINWLPQYSFVDLQEKWQNYKQNNARKKLKNAAFSEIPQRLWLYFLHLAQISPEKNYADVSNKSWENLQQILQNNRVAVQGKSTHKEEFVTAGGVDLKEINLKTFESKLFPKLYFAGEVLDIDALTGGFNFQACWSAGFVVGESLELY
ncbi:MAG: NAD(P)/FAD-dependent oxidoreductase [Chitinophagales bacterium]|nr:NAD(P)/FAD-dependent oxidoreductase [Bacteroidota bacterium]MCB9044318.1 NAD(P)/FAD-dependent oxidoreductase [Chitinophagales bacterium]